MIWYYANEGKRVGPVDDAEFQALVETGVILAETLVWNETLPKWLRYDEVSQGVRQTTPPRMSVAEVPQRGRQTASPRMSVTARCNECGNSFPQDDMIRYGDVYVCANCKPIFVQRLKEGAELRGEMIYAGFWIRFGAKFLDGLIQWVASVVIGIITGLVLMPAVGRGSQLRILVNLLVNVLTIGVAVAYNTYFLGKYGATPGKMACGLKVVTSDGGKISYARAIGRYFAEWLNFLTLYIGYIMAGFDEEKRALHDRICDTRVIRKRS